MYKNDELDTIIKRINSIECAFKFSETVHLSLLRMFGDKIDTDVLVALAFMYRNIITELWSLLEKKLRKKQLNLNTIRKSMSKNKCVFTDSSAPCPCLIAEDDLEKLRRTDQYKHLNYDRNNVIAHYGMYEDFKTTFTDLEFIINEVYRIINVYSSKFENVGFGGYGKNAGVGRDFRILCEMGTLYRRKMKDLLFNKGGSVRDVLRIWPLVLGYDYDQRVEDLLKELTNAKTNNY